VSAMQNIKLYHCEGTRSARVRWMLEEIGAPYDLIPVDLQAGEHFHPDFVAKNPNKAVPVLEFTLDGTKHRMIESGAMVAALAELFPGGVKLAPSKEDALERLRYHEMMFFSASWMDAILWQIRTHEDLLAAEERDHKSISRARQKFSSEIVPQLVTRLSDHPYIIGDSFSAVDCIMGHNVLWASSLNLLGDDDSRKVLKAYIERIQKRPAFQAAFNDVENR